ncbi:MAG TPA: diguanylate cyclase AdrA, partial [Arenimonas sp.]|nr:diguanylate cyclase AdrA [Arenimonas sp.]
AGRLGGDEFAIALPATQAEAEVVAERLRESVQAFSLPQAPGLRCSVSIGLAQARDDDLGLREWIESADKALYRAKHGGRNRTATQSAGALAQTA